MSRFSTSIKEALADLEKKGCSPHGLQVVSDLFEKAQSGQLTKADLDKVLNNTSEKDSMSFVLHISARDTYTQHLSWGVYTKDYMDDLAKLMRTLSGKEAPKVLEVCAGQGLLGPHMASRGLHWCCTDVKQRQPHVQPLSAKEALEEYADQDLDIVFASWIPWQADIDLLIAKEWVLKHHKPFVFLGEGGGEYCCTGSKEFWAPTIDAYGRKTLYSRPAYEISSVDNHDPDFRDVPRWIGMCDSTFVVLDRSGEQNARR